ncbi:hypothetical protein [Pseudoxanthomonas suwonensis]|uniref:Uncharacterized protein n=1 Tax=Pseudoxanthomonas suwonensis TaxID=314722 RepID=A0A0E3Z3M0_9GAMM|nr:hypothetical protein [Pseudoxanthomonas suwonensis]AKC87584.1 hypothetical protein WQ53_13295 [Pseudoxanthomonas suwonensis]
MSQTSRLARAAAAVLLASTVVATLGGCSWFRKGPKGDYALAVEQRPLEVPPDLTLPDASGAMALPPAGGQRASAPGAAPAASPSGFTVAGNRDTVFAQIGTALEGIEGVTIASRAQLLGTYDVNYQGLDFLVRVVAVENGVYVSAVDPRGVPATAEAPRQLIAALQAALARG